MTAYLLGAYQGNRHLSIDNYFQYCQREIPVYLPEWRFSSIRPGCFSDDYFTHAVVPRSRAWNDNYLRWPLTLSRLRADVYHIVDHGLAWYSFFLNRGKTIITVHDLINLLVIRGRLPLTPIPPRLRTLIKATAHLIQKSDAIVCVSQNTADTVMAELSVPAKRIHVVHNIVPQVFKPVSCEERVRARRVLLAGAESLILHVGKPSRYKNRLGVLKIFGLIDRDRPGSRLVLTSEEITPEEQSFLKGKSWASSVSVLKPEQQTDLRLLYGASDLLLFPSLYEGFGWPPLEAMACGCPVIASSAGSLAEVVGDAAITIADPLDSQAFARAACRVLQESSLAAQLRAAGLKRAANFTPEKLTPQLAEVYKTVAA
jgi:glycosyltransferase involved in cell wall biosynthesis